MTTKQPTEYCMEVYLFGSTSSPSCANLSLRKTAEEYTGDCSRDVIDALLKNFYADDCPKSVKSSYIATNLREQLCKLLLRGRFRLTKWLCKDKDVLQAILRCDKASSVLDLDLDTGVLGVQWNMETDMLTF